MIKLSSILYMLTHKDQKCIFQTKWFQISAKVWNRIKFRRTVSCYENEVLGKSHQSQLGYIWFTK